jgi:acyl-CoA reductase-like NAD-dependent aldehyde dehydrogenase
VATSSAEKSPVTLTISPKKWPKVDLPNRLYYLESLCNNLHRVAPFWIEEEANLRGHLPTSDEGAESWLLGPIPVARTLRYLINGVRSGGRPRVPFRRLRIDGRSVTRVFPYGFHEHILFWDTEAHVWSIGGQHQGTRYRRARDAAPGPALVLGASNVSSIVVTDLLCKLFCENRAVVCKVPPRLAPLKPILDELFHPMVRDRHVQILYGGKELGQTLLDLPVFETVHLTGSVQTYQQLLKSNRHAHRTFTAELGCVTPAMIVPGPWNQSQLLFQARHLASILVLNGGYNCVTPQILVLGKNWSYKEAFLRALRAELEKYQGRDDNYEGQAARREDFRKDYPQAESYGPRTLIRLCADEPTRLFREEAFCGMLGIVELESHDSLDFLEKASRFCNEKLWGDLSCMLLVDPETRRLHERAIAHTLAELEYGTVGLNVFTGLAFASSVTPWGSYLDGKSNTGNGWVHNTFFFDQPEKTVMEGSFVPKVPLPWIKPFPQLSEVGRALLYLELNPTAVNMARFVKRFGASIWKGKKR